MRSRRSTVLATCIATALVATACASESDSDDDVSGGGDGSLGAYLDGLPALDGDGPVTVTYADLARAAEIAGIERPDDPGDSDALVDYIQAITGQRSADGESAPVGALAPDAAQITRALEIEDFIADVGWSILEVDSYAERATPPERVTLLDGDFSEDQLADSLGDADDGVWSVGNPDGSLDLADITPARPTGGPLWLALDGDRLTVTENDGDMGATRSADGGAGTLADDPALAALAAGLDDRDVYSAALVADEAYLTDFAGRVLGPTASPDQAEALADLPRCEGVIGAAAGLADDGGPLVVLALAQVDEAAAEANAEVVAEVLDEGTQPRAGRPWAGYLTVESVEVEGTAVVATARPADDLALAVPYSFLFDRSFPPC